MKQSEKLEQAIAKLNVEAEQLRARQNEIWELRAQLKHELKEVRRVERQEQHRLQSI